MHPHTRETLTLAIFKLDMALWPGDAIRRILSRPILMSPSTLPEPMLTYHQRGCCRTHLKPISQELFKISIRKTSLENIPIILLSRLPGAIELI